MSVPLFTCTCKHNNIPHSGLYGEAFTGTHRHVLEVAFLCGCWLALTGSRWKHWAQLGRWSVLSRSSLHPHLHRSCMRANKRPSTALDRWHRDEGNTTNISKTNPHAFSSSSVQVKAIKRKNKRGGGGLCFVVKSIPDVDFSCGRSVEAWRDEA